MASFPLRLPRLWNDRRGATIVEFAFVAPVLAIVTLGFMEFAHWNYVRSTAIGAIEETARSAGVGGAAVDPRTGELRAETIVKKVAPSATFTWVKKSHKEFSAIDRAEKLTDDKDGDLRYDVGDCWEDSVPNNRYDTNSGADGVGGADDIVLYEMTVSWTPLVRLSGLVPGVPDVRTSKVSTIVKRQPFAAQSAPVIRC